MPSARNALVLVILTFLTFPITPSRGLAELVASPDGGGASSLSSWGAKSEIPSEAHLECMVSYMTKKPDLAKRTATGLEQAIKAMKFSPGKFNSPSLLNFLAQSMEESGLGDHLTGPTEDYGIIQVSKGNLPMAAECMAKKEGGNACEGAVSNPEKVLGNGSKNDLFCPALASLCWWQKNIAENTKHEQYAQNTTQSCSDAISQITNTGHVGGKMTGGTTANCARRYAHLKKLKDADMACQN